MRVAVLAPAGSVHTRKWIHALRERGYELLLVTAHDPAGDYEGVTVHRLPFRPPLGFFVNHFRLRKILAAFKPDLLHTHSASGYGLTARLAGFRPDLLSVWGSDVFTFPHQSPIHNRIVTKNLAHAFQLASTSEVMKRRAEELVKPRRPIRVTPFGVDTTRFSPGAAQIEPGVPTIGVVKFLDPNYGIDTSVRAFRLIRSSFHGAVRLVIAGAGPYEKRLRLLIEELGLSEDVTLLGQVPHAQIPSLLRSFDVFLNLSKHESFGVAVLEASACGIPVVATNVGGLPEVVVPGETGFLVPTDDPQAAADAVLRIINDPALKKRLGENGRRWVSETYDWNGSVDRLERLYEDVVENWRKLGKSEAR